MGSEMLRGVYPERSEGLSMTEPALKMKILHRARGGARHPACAIHVLTCMIVPAWLGLQEVNRFS